MPNARVNMISVEEKKMSMIVNGFVEEIRDLGGIKFVKIYTKDGYVQVTLPKGKVSDELFTKLDDVTRQSVVSVHGDVKDNESAPGGKEVIPEKIDIVTLSETPLPLDPSGKTPAGLDTRFDWRPLNLRNPNTLAIFKIQSKLAEGMRNYFKNNGFIEFFTPCIMGAAAEGGSEVFKFDYFGKEAFLRQDVQLHRELAIVGGVEKFFEIGPNWRAELSHTRMHLCEHRGLCVEIGFIEDERDTMRIEEQVIISAFERVKNDCAAELELLGKEVTIPKAPFPELKFPDIYEILEKMGKKVEFGEDIDREAEHLLYEHINEKEKTEFFFLNRFPSKVKPFYVMRVDDEPQWARSVDMMFKGLELSSGGQREHRFEKIISQAKETGIPAKSIDWFAKHFKYGSPSMGGFGLGLERLTMKLLDIENVREAALFPRDPERLLP